MIGSISDCDTETDRGETVACRDCQDTGIVLVQRDVDHFTEHTCECQDPGEPDFDAAADMQRDDLLTAREGERHAA